MNYAFNPCLALKRLQDYFELNEIANFFVSWDDICEISEDMTTFLVSEHSEQIILNGFYVAFWEILWNKNLHTGTILTMTDS